MRKFIFILFIVVAAVVAFLFIQPKGDALIGNARCFPSSVVSNEAVSITISLVTDDHWLRKVKSVTARIPATSISAAASLPMVRSGDRWKCIWHLPEGAAFGTYTVDVHVVRSSDDQGLVRQATLRVLPEEGMGFAGAAHPYIRYQGRISGLAEGRPNLLWPGNKVDVRFRGPSIAVRFENTDPDARFYAIIDGDDQHPVDIKLRDGEHDYVIAENLSNGWHALTLHRLTEVWKECHVVFKGIVLAPGSGILPPQELSGMKLEFYGDSITAGNHAEKGRKDTDDKSRMNNYLAFSARTARAFDAEFACIAQSGIALTSRYKEENGIMDSYYQRTVPYSDVPAWNFTSWQPDAVVINLLTNDDWFWGNSTNIPPDSFFSERYKAFIADIRRHYPNTHIFCVLGTMPSVADWPPPNPDMVGVIEQTVKEFNRSGDGKIYSLMFKYQHPDPGHPSSWHHEHLMKSKLVPFMRDKMKIPAEGNGA